VGKKIYQVWLTGGSQSLSGEGRGREGMSKKDRLNDAEALRGRKETGKGLRWTVEYVQS